jgi:hypothetical protein
MSATIDRAPWNALVDDSGQNLDGTPWNKAAIKGVLLDPIDGAIGAAGWTPYTPVWAGADNAGPALGNGQLTGRYALIGKTCHFILYLQPGTTTTFGTSTYWSWTVPVPGHPTMAMAGAIVGFVGPGGAPLSPGVCYNLSATTFYIIAGTGGFVNPTVPFTWAAPNCRLYVRGTYETA